MKQIVENIRKWAKRMRGLVVSRGALGTARPTLAALLALAALAPLTAHAQAPASGLRVLQMTNTALAFQGLAGPWTGIGVWNTNAAIPATAATNYYIPIQVVDSQGEGYGDITISWGFKQMSGAATDVCKLDIQASGNGNDWFDGYYVLSVAASGSTRVFTNATIALNALPYLRVAWVTNACATIMTNVTVEVFNKKYRGR